MPVTYSSTLKNTRMNAVLSAIGTTGKLVIGTAGMAATLATLPLNNPVGSVANGVLTFNASGVSAAGSGAGSAAAAKITDGSSDVATGFTVSAAGGGGDFIISNTSIAVGQTVTLSSGAITHG